MEVELGLKITKTKDGVSSISDFQFAKDRAGTIFFSKETDTKFILYAHLKGLSISLSSSKIFSVTFLVKWSFWSLNYIWG